MQQTLSQIVGSGILMAATETHPAGVMYSGGYDAEKNVLYLASVIGHPRGVAAAGGEPSGDHVAGLRILIVASGTVYWATDSMSLPRGLNQMEVEAVHGALERHFQNRSIVRVERLECIPR